MCVRFYGNFVTMVIGESMWFMFDFFTLTSEAFTFGAALVKIMRHNIGSCYTTQDNFSDHCFLLDGLSDNVCYWYDGVRCAVSHNCIIPEMPCVG